MFVTTSTFARRPPQGLDTTARYWAGMILAAEKPWFVLTYRLFESTEAPLQTVLVACDDTLASVVERVKAHSVTSLRWVVHAGDDDRRWVMKDVAEVWAASDAERLLKGPVLWRLAGEAGLRSWRVSEVDASDDGRRLVWAWGGGDPHPGPLPRAGEGGRKGG